LNALLGAGANDFFPRYFFHGYGLFGGGINDIYNANFLFPSRLDLVF